MVKIRYEVLGQYEPEKDYGIHIPAQYARCLDVITNENEEFSPMDIVKKYPSEFLRSDKPNLRRTQVLVSTAIQYGKQLNLINIARDDILPFDEFCKFETIQYFKEQTRGIKQKHKETTNQGKLGGTQKLYIYKLWGFSNWLKDQEFHYKRIKQVDVDMYKKVDETVRLKHVEHFLKLYQDSMNNTPEFVRMIKRYLLSDVHQDKRSSTVNNIVSAIRSYFRKNDSPIIFDFDPETKYHTSTQEEYDPSLSLEDLLKMLTVGRPSILEKAVVLCKFHRGLDNSTFVDRFNFEAWPQIVKHFGTEEYMRWDLNKCPVPISLTRVKTGYFHRGYLERDAIDALQNYLQYRFKKTGKVMSDDQPLFINSLKKPIGDWWIGRLVPRLATNAGIQSSLKAYKLMRRSEKTSHEMRDLLKTTLIVSGTADYVCDIVIGHKVGDSYEKQDKLYPDKSRSEYAKASKKLNIFSRISQSLSETSTKEELERQLSDIDFKSRRDMDSLKSGFEAKMDEMQNDMKEMQFKYMEAKNQPMSDEELERLAKKMKRI